MLCDLLSCMVVCIIYSIFFFHVLLIHVFFSLPKFKFYTLKSNIIVHNTNKIHIINRYIYWL
jgi:hypothetical protein